MWPFGWDVRWSPRMSMPPGVLRALCVAHPAHPYMSRTIAANGTLEVLTWHRVLMPGIQVRRPHAVPLVRHGRRDGGRVLLALDSIVSYAHNTSDRAEVSRIRPRKLPIKCNMSYFQPARSPTHTMVVYLRPIP